MIVYCVFLAIMSGCVAQLAEHWIPNPKVVGSNPAAFMYAAKVRPLCGIPSVCDVVGTCDVVNRRVKSVRLV